MTYDVRADVLAAIAELDEDQTDALNKVRALPQVLPIVAAAGSGKTRTLITTMAALMVLDGLAPGDIVGITFTSKAGKEIKERLAHLVGGELANRCNLGTYHGIALRQLRGLDAGRWHEDRCVDFRSKVASSRTIWRAICQWSRDGIPGLKEKSFELPGLPDDYQLAVDNLRSWGLRSNSPEATGACAAFPLERLHDAWDAYERSKAALHAWDFADALDAFQQALERGQLALAPRVVLVDEAQDNSAVQFQVSRALAARRPGTLVFLGDPRQAIYSWRGAHPKLFPDIIAAFPHADIRTNYRSGQAIVDASNALDLNLPVEDALCGRKTPGLVEVVGADDPLAEATYVASQIDRHKPDDYAILVRTNSKAGMFEGALMSAGVPTVRVGGTPFFERYDVLTFVAYCALTAYDSFPALERVINSPKRYLGKPYLQAVDEQMKYHPFFEAMSVAGANMKGPSQEGSRGLVRLLRQFRNQRWPAQVPEITKLLLSALPKKESAQPDEDRRAIPEVCAALAVRFASAADFVRYADAAAQNSVAADTDTRGRVVISTVHRFKGLERPTVFVSMPSGGFPLARAATPDAVAEEMRLVYVAWTRARDRLVLTWPAVGMDGRRLGPSGVIAQTLGESKLG